MQRINVRIINPVFFLLFFGTPALCLIVVVQSFVGPAENFNLLLIIGAGSYLVGPFGITLMFNVPLNNRLAAADKSNESEWQDYQTKWQRWNHLRTCIGIISIILLASGLSSANV